MELRHLRYFVAVAEEGSLTVAAEKRLHTAQPSLSRQLRDLEAEIGAQLFVRNARGVELTPAGRAFLDHARLALGQASAAVDAARRAARPPKRTFGLGFLTGQELIWLPGAMAILKEELPLVDITVSSDYSPVLAEELDRGRLDAAFMRAEAGRPGLHYQVVATEPLLVFLPSDHRLAAQPAIALEDLRGETFIGMSGTAPAYQAVLAAYLRDQGVAFSQKQEIDNLAMAMSLIASTGGFTLIPDYARNFLPWSVTCRPLTGVVPTIDLVVGYRKGPPDGMLKTFLSRLTDLHTTAPRTQPLNARDHARSAG